MAYRNVCEEIEAAWDMASEKWSAEIKAKYISQIYLALLSEANGMYQRNDSLDYYAKQCTNAVDE